MDTIGALCDKLSIVNIKIFTLEDIKRGKFVSDKEIADATKKTNTLNVQRTDLISEIDEKINHMVKTGEVQKLYGSMKMYGKQ